MMSYPPEHSRSGHSYSGEFEKIASMRRALLMLLSKHRTTAVTEPGISFFCNEKVPSPAGKPEVRASYSFSDN